MSNNIGTFTSEKNVVMNGWAPYYDLFMKTFTLGRDKLLRKKELDIIGINKGNYVLEIGCGTGTLSLLAKDRVGSSGKVCGIDAASEMIRVSVKKRNTKKKEIEFQQADITNIPYEDNHFDVVFCSFMIFHMSSDKREKGFQEIFRVLKNNGTIAIIDMLKDDGLAVLENSLKQVFSEIDKGYREMGFLLPKLAFIKGIAKKSN